MILIDGSFESNSTFLLGASSVCSRVRRLTFWEQITDIRTENGQSVLSIDGRDVEPEETLILARQPRFVDICGGPSEADFMWAEWNSALTSVLYNRRRFVPNGKLLIPNMQITENPSAFHRRFACAMRVGSSISKRSIGSKHWVLATKGTVTSYPAKYSFGLDFDLHAALFQALVDSELDYAVLELLSDADATKLNRVHVAPPSYGPIELHRAIAQCVGGPR